MCCPCGGVRREGSLGVGGGSDSKAVCYGALYRQHIRRPRQNEFPAGLEPNSSPANLRHDRPSPTRRRFASPLRTSRRLTVATATTDLAALLLRPPDVAAARTSVLVTSKKRFSRSATLPGPPLRANRSRRPSARPALGIGPHPRSRDRSRQRSLATIDACILAPISCVSRVPRYRSARVDAVARDRFSLTQPSTRD